MELSKEQYDILQHFYQQTKIFISDFPTLGINKDSTAFSDLIKECCLRRSDLKSYHSKDFVASYPTSYTITEDGKRIYENYLAHLAKQEYDQKSLELQTRQTVSSEEAVLVSKEANKISRRSKIISWISLGISILSGLASIASAIVSIIVLINK